MLRGHTNILSLKLQNEGENKHLFREKKLH